MRLNTRLTTVGLVALIATATPAMAATVNVDLSGAVSGATVNGVGASFAQGFSFGPLALAPSGPITVAFFNPGVSAASNSLLSQPNNQAPLAMYLNGATANSVTFTAGSASGGSVTLTGYDAAGVATGAFLLNFNNGYDVYTVGGLGNFAGIQFSATNDPAGVRYMNFSYESIRGGVPEPAAWTMLILGFGAVGTALRRTRRTRAALAYS